MNLDTSIQQACQRIAPLWPLNRFVAVNPFLGFSDRSFAGTARLLREIQGADLTLPLSWYAQRYREGAITRGDLEVAVQRASREVADAFAAISRPLNVPMLLDALDDAETEDEPLYRPDTFSNYLDARGSTHWHHTVREEIARWCAAFYDRGQADWRPFDPASGFYAGWHELVRHDRNLVCAGIPNAHRRLASYPDAPRDAVREALAVLGIPEGTVSEWCHRALLTLPGWSGYLRYLDREKELRGGEPTELVQLLAITLNHERLLFEHHASDIGCILGWKRSLEEEPVEKTEVPFPPRLALRLLWQAAFEHARERAFAAALRAGRERSFRADLRPEIQAAFCIDVRSEPFRRHLEASLPTVSTIGFAGFFGVPLSHLPAEGGEREARCPALLAPTVCSGEQHEHGEAATLEQARKQAWAAAWKEFKESAASCFSFVETIGLSYLWKTLRHAFCRSASAGGRQTRPRLDPSLSLEQKVQLAAGIFTGLTLDRTCARLVLLCGHGSTTTNNPYASGLDCGACGGFPGDVNARIAAALLNDATVRDALADRGITMPADAFFIAGLHNTTTDEVELFDIDAVPAGHRSLVDALRAALQEAGRRNAAWRARLLDAPAADPVTAVRARSADWSQVRPEWGLAGNAGLLIAPRHWSRDAALEGKVFLHEYDPVIDPDGARLESILAGPLVVASWINLQYFASAVDNRHFGSGHKAIHNVVGALGVALGNENDLRPGLPLQSVSDGTGLIHEPCRLHVMIAAAPEVIERLLERLPAVRELVENEWLHLFSLGVDGTRFDRRERSGRWLPAPSFAAGATHNRRPTPQAGR